MEAVNTWAKIQSNGIYNTAAPKRKKRKRNKKKKTANPKQVARTKFYASDEWVRLRYKALKANDGRCELCGRSKHDNATLHVDHIKPRSKHPELELELSNLQVLCSTCNWGKSNKDDTDWRSDLPRDDWWNQLPRT